MNRIYKVFALVMIPFMTLVQIQFAQENSATDSGSIKTINYDLAYPGILPDHPLYILKKIRDKVTAFLITDPQKKVEYYLLQTDKGILATAILVDKNKMDIAQETAFKAEHNYTLLTYELKKTPKKPDSAYFQKLKTAALKHQEVLSKLINRVPEDKQKSFKQVLEFSKTNFKTVDSYQREKRVFEE